MAFDCNTKNLGSLEELNSNGVEVYFPKSLNSDKIEDIYSDILYYGKRFNLEKMLLKWLKNEKDILIVQNENKGKKRAKILAYDSQKCSFCYWWQRNRKYNN